METVSLLRVIAENTRPDNSEIWISVISALSALLGALIGAVLLYNGTKRQISSFAEIEQRKLQATIVTAERLRWLQDIRERHAILYAELDMQYSILKRTNTSEQLQQTLDEFSAKVMNQTNMITNMLISSNPHEYKLKRALQLSLRIMLSAFKLRSEGKNQIYDKRYSLVKGSAFKSMESIGIESWDKIRRLQ